LAKPVEGIERPGFSVLEDAARHRIQEEEGENKKRGKKM